MDDGELIRKTVGKKRGPTDVFERVRILNRSLEKLGIKRTDDGEHIRKVVGRPRS